MAKRSLVLPIPRPASTWHQHPDLAGVLLLCPTLLLSVFALPAWLAPVRIVLGLLFVLVVPGYALTAALFPRRDDVAYPERLALSLGLSVATVPLLGLALRFSPWGIAALPMVVAIATVSAVAALVALARRQQVGTGHGAVDRATLQTDLTLLAAVVTVVATVLTAVHSFAPSGPSTEFYLLGPSGELESYARSVPAGGAYEVALAVTNQEGRRESFRVRARTSRTAVTTELPELAHGETWRGALPLTAPSEPGPALLSLDLYRTHDAEPYRSLRLWTSIADGTDDASIEVRGRVP